MDAVKQTVVGARCKNCAYFFNDPLVLEQVFGGLAAMSSGFASVRDQDGLCRRHGLYVSARDGCPTFKPATLLAGG
jgi:hypothetical protein